MTLIAFEDGKAVFRDGKVGAGEECCCDDGPCPPCTTPLPRKLFVTVEGFPDGYFWFGRNGGAPPVGGGFSPNCGPDPNGPVYRNVGQAFGIPSYVSTRLADFNGTYEVSRPGDISYTLPPYYPIPGPVSDECCPQWFGEIPLSSAGGPTGQPATGCLSVPVSLVVSLCKEQSFTNVAISSAGQGSGATAEVTQITAGEIVAVAVTNQGSGYASLEIIRVEPNITLSVSSFSGTGASLSATVSQATDINNEVVWEITSVSVNQAGSGYNASDSVVFSANGGVVQSPAFATLKLDRQQPSLGVTLPFAQGTGATFSVTLFQGTDSNSESVWGVDSVTVTNGGAGYSAFGEFAQINVIDGQEQLGAILVAYNTRVQPTLSVSVPFSSAGSGAVLSAALSQVTDASGKPAWEVSSVAVLNGGTGYSSFDFVDFSSSDTLLSAASGSLNVSGGVIQSVTISNPGLYYAVGDAISEVEVLTPGEYYKTNGSITSATVVDGGEYYQNQQTNNVITESVSVLVMSNTGKNADISPVIDTNPSSGTFGQIVALTINSGGEKYAQQEDAWVVDFSSSGGINALAGADLSPGPGETLCAIGGSADQSGKEQPLSGRGVLVSEDPCAETLLNNTYDAFYKVGIFPDPPSGFPDAAEYSVSGAFFCENLLVVNWGGGPLKVTISTQE